MNFQETLIQPGGKYGFLSAKDRTFLLRFTEAITARGFGVFAVDNTMFVYARGTDRTKNVAARIYLGGGTLTLRMYFRDVAKHQAYIKAAPDYIRDVFLGHEGDCAHCGNERDGSCRYRKEYEIGGVTYGKCGGWAFTFGHPDMERLDDYLGIFDEFYPAKKRIKTIF